jgi:WD40 repeat protein/DNA-binding SARP family transcriptional activator
MLAGRRDSVAGAPPLIAGGSATTNLDVRLLGRFSLEVAGQAIDLPSRGAQALVAYLALSPGVAHRREHLAALLWPDSTEANSRNNLRVALWRARKSIEAPPAGLFGRFHTSEIEIALRLAAGDVVDAAAFDGSAAAKTSEELIATASAYGGELLPGFYDDWVVLERQRLQAAFETRMSLLLDRLAVEERWGEIGLWGERWIALGQTPEPAYRALMIAHAAAGDRSRVAATYRRCVSALKADLGVEPSEETIALFHSLTDGGRPPAGAVVQARTLPSSMGTAIDAADVGVDVAAGEDAFAGDLEVAAAGDPPFMGLPSFDEEDAEWFFGRESLTSQLIERIRGGSFVAVVGASGSGKSSVVRAGVVPALRRALAGPAGDRANVARVVVLTPTAAPLDALAVGLLDRSASRAQVVELAARLVDDPATLCRHVALGGDGPVTLVVDQFEEVFTLGRDPDARRTFIQVLMHAASGACGGGVRVVIVLRADFYADCAIDATLRDGLAANQAFIGRMSTVELRQAIEMPAARGHWTFEPGLVDLILRDVGDEPGALPLLSHALLETWHRRRGRTLTLRAYAESGGVRGAIARSADRLFNHRFSPAEQVVARRILIRLTELGAGSLATRRRARMSELVAPGEAGTIVITVLDALVEARLVTVSGDSVEVAHEALITGWPALGRWLAEDRDALRVHRHLTEAAQAWEGFDRDPDQVYRGARLARATEWAADHDVDMNPLEQAYMTASQEVAAQGKSEVEARQQRELEVARRLADAEGERAEAAAAQVRTERTSATRLRRRAVYLAAALLVAVGLAVRAGFLEDDARRSAATAQQNAIAAERNAIAAQDNAIAAQKNEAAAQEANRVAQSRELAAASIVNLEIDPERSILLALRAVATDRTLEAEEALHRSVSESRVELSLAHPASVVSASFSPDGTRIASGAGEGNATIWDAASGRQLFRLVGHTGDVNSAVFSPDGSLIATAGDDGTVRIWDASSGAALRVLAGHTDNVARALFSPDGKRLASTGLDGTVRIWDVATGRQVRLIRTGDVGVRALAWSSDGRIATGRLDGIIQIWAVADGKLLRKIVDGPRATYGVVWSPDGTQLASASADNMASIWDPRTGERLKILAGHTSVVQGIAWSLDGRRIATASYDSTAKIWDATTGLEQISLAGHSGLVYDVSFSADGSRVVTSSDDHTARVWTIDPIGEKPTLGTGLDPMWNVAFSPVSSTILATTASKGEVTIWDSATGARIRDLVGHTGDVQGVAFSPDGKRLATAGEDRTARIWDVATGSQILLLTGHVAPETPAFFPGVLDVAFSPDGARLATVGDDGTARIWDSTTGRQLLKLTGHDGPVGGVVFSPDGSRLATSGWDGIAIVWNAATGERLLTLTGHDWIVRRITFSPDGTKIATASFDGTARIWDAATGSPVATLTGHTALVFGIAFSPDGAHVATASSDKTVKIWDVATATELLTLHGHAAGVVALAFSPDGTSLATASEDGTTRIDLLRLDDLVTVARSRVTRDLDTAECQRYLHVSACP